MNEPTPVDAVERLLEIMVEEGTPRRYNYLTVELDHAYIQFAYWGGRPWLLMEAVSNRFLPRERRLAPRGRRLLHCFGFESPGRPVLAALARHETTAEAITAGALARSPNYFRYARCDAAVMRRLIAELTLAIFRRVYRCRPDLGPAYAVSIQGQTLGAAELLRPPRRLDPVVGPLFPARWVGTL
jgi:hypothetical protein